MAQPARQCRRRQAAPGRARQRKERSRNGRHGGGAAALREGAPDPAARPLRRPGRHAGGLEGQAQRTLPLRAAVVPHHRCPRLGQDNRPASLGTEVSSRRRGWRGGHPGRGRHAQLRLVVHRPGRPDRYRRTLHHAGQRSRERSRDVERFPGDAEAIAPQAAGERRARDRVGVGPPDALAGRASRLRGNGPPEVAGTARGARHSLSDLPARHQGRPSRGLHRLLRDDRQGPASDAVGRDLPDEGQPGAEPAALRSRIRPARAAARGRPDRPPATRTRSAEAGAHLRFCGPVRGPARRPAGVPRGHFRFVSLRGRCLAARRLFRERHPGRNADRPRARLDCAPTGSSAPWSRPTRRAAEATF